MQVNTVLLRTVTNFGYGYKRDPIRIRNNHNMGGGGLDDVRLLLLYIVVCLYSLQMTINDSVLCAQNARHSKTMNDKGKGTPTPPLIIAYCVRVYNI